MLQAVQVASELKSQRSESIGELIAALAKAQGQMRPAVKDSENPHFRSKYASLAAVWEACRSVLSANGLAVVQEVEGAPGGVTVVTTLGHSSGQWMTSRCWVPVSKQDAQGYGSAATYARRYSLSAIVGVAPEDDDDGNAATGKPAAPPPAGIAALKATLAPKDAGEKAKAAAQELVERHLGGNFNEPPPPSDEDGPVQGGPYRTGVTAPFGKGKGKDLAELTEDDLSFLERTVRASVDDPAKARFRASNVKLLTAVQGELGRRSA